ncbi:pre-mRNA-splicing factor syf2 [Cocos nucifera]|uniref:Pre-mRNA-splicing factor SYF2 n=1 Tax=Cocos nucifera TaxID=13894 RepID=A0A8K0I6N6_COCNU|nr:pre-mRNA-splicing factor syf2 [Cocos nucifera]
MVKEGKVHPDCINASNPYHECVDYCLRRIAEAKARADDAQKLLEDDNAKEPEERTVHPDCVNASNRYHECSEFCFKKIAEAKDRYKRTDPSEMQQESGAPSSFDDSDQNEVPQQREGQAEQNDGGDSQHVQNDAESGLPHLTERQKKMFELRLKMNEARKANQMAMVAEKRKIEAPTESRGISKEHWFEERKKKIGKLLDSNGLDMSKAYMLDTQEMAEAKYKKWEKDPAPYGWDVFNQKTLYNAYKKRTKNIEVDMEAYNNAKEADPEFYREASSLQYGKAPKAPDENIDRMVKELHDREAKRKSFSRRRRFHEEKDIDSINDRNEHFNKKIERAFGKYTLEIKNNLERGTALPD